MRRLIRIAIIAAVVLPFAASLSGVIGPAIVHADNSRWGAGYFPNVTLIDQDGVEVKFYDDLLKGKIVAIDLIYTTCKYACPLETARLAQVQKLLGDRMGREVFFYSITIDPDHDTPAVLKEYAEKYHAGRGWSFLTGKAADIELISRKLGLYSEPDPSNADGHTPSLIVGNEATGQWMRNSALDNPRFLARTIGDWMTSWKNASAAAPGANYSEVRALRLDQGQYTFATHCAPCHSIGDGDKIGPDLKGVTATRDRGWLTRFILAPDKVLEQGDPTAQQLLAKYGQVRMPRLDLTETEVSDVIAYLGNQDRKNEAAGSANQAVVNTAQGVVAASVDLSQVVASYLVVQRALHNDTLAGVREAAGRLVSQSSVLEARASAFAGAAGDLQQAGDLKAARAAFGRVGDALMMYLRESGSRGAEGVKVAYCPMVRKYWLQRGDVVANPFYGSAMPDCGRFVDSLPDLRK